MVKNHLHLSSNFVIDYVVFISETLTVSKWKTVNSILLMFQSSTGIFVRY